MADMIDRAATDPDAALALHDKADDVNRLFGSEEGLMLSLRHKWVTMLTAKLDQGIYEGVPAVETHAELAAAHPGLRALLASAALRSVRVRALERNDQRIVDLYTGYTGAHRQTVA